MFQCVIVEEIIMLSSILLSWETFYRNSVQLLHFHLSNCHFQKKTCAVQKVNKRTANWFISTKSRLYQAVWQQKVFFQKNRKTIYLFPLNLDCIKLCDSKKFFISLRKTGSTGECWSNIMGRRRRRRHLQKPWKSNFCNLSFLRSKKADMPR